MERMLANHLMGLPAVNDQGEFVGAVLLHDLEKADANEAIEAHAVEGTPYVTPGRVGGNGQVEDAVGVRCERRHAGVLTIPNQGVSPTCATSEIEPLASVRALTRRSARAKPCRSASTYLPKRLRGLRSQTATKIPKAIASPKTPMRPVGRYPAQRAPVRPIYLRRIECVRLEAVLWIKEAYRRLLQGLI